MAAPAIVGNCEFCNASTTLLGDGIVSKDFADRPVTCDKLRARVSPAKSRDSANTIDHASESRAQGMRLGHAHLCPECRAAGRTAW